MESVSSGRIGNLRVDPSFLKVNRLRGIDDSSSVILPTEIDSSSSDEIISSTFSPDGIVKTTNNNSSTVELMQQFNSTTPSLALDPFPGVFDHDIVSPEELFKDFLKPKEKDPSETKLENVTWSDQKFIPNIQISPFNWIFPLLDSPPTTTELPNDIPETTVIPEPVWEFGFFPIIPGPDPNASNDTIENVDDAPIQNQNDTSKDLDALSTDPKIYELKPLKVEKKSFKFPFISYLKRPVHHHLHFHHIH